jgi:molybdopterin synthase catalytic subunit
VDRFVITSRPLSVSAAARAVTRKDCGGIAVFAGVVRDHHDGKRVTRISYTAFSSMAKKEFARYAAEARRKWKELGSFYVAHRTGRLRHTEASVVIAVSAVHRAEAFAACRHVIERLKESAPIWKEEFYRRGKAWIGNAL